MQKNPPFDGLSANRGGEIRTRDLLFTFTQLRSFLLISLQLRLQYFGGVTHRSPMNRCLEGHADHVGLILPAALQADLLVPFKVASNRSCGVSGNGFEEGPLR